MDEIANGMSMGFPREVDIQLIIDNNPEYIGSVHDDAGARLAGYKAAIVPGAFIYSHISRLAIDAWGEEWARHGAMNVRFARPAYSGDRVVLRASDLDGDSLNRSRVTVHNSDGVELATGWIEPPDATVVVPPLSDVPMLPKLDHPPRTEAGQLAVGARTRTFERELTKADYLFSRRSLGEDHPLYGADGPVHSTMLMRMAMAETNATFNFPASIILVETEAKHFGLVRPGQTIKISGEITNVYTHGRHYYFESEEYIVADQTVSARIRRKAIYATGPRRQDAK